MTPIWKSLLVAACAANCVALTMAAARADGSVATVYYPNGDVATTTAKCGPGELCATIALATGDQIKVLTGGSGHCNPYVMTFRRYDKSQLMAVWSTPTDRNPDTSGTFGGSTCGGFHNTHMPLEGGVIDMGIFQNRDGTVFVQFFGGSPTPPAPPSK